MPTNSYVDLESGTAPDQLLYDDSQVTTREIMIPAGETITRGDILYIAREGAVASEATPGEANVGNGTLTATFDTAGSATEQTITATYDGAAWDFSGSVSGALTQDAATGLNIDIGQAIVDIVAGTVAFEEDDTFTFTITKTGSVVARKASSSTSQFNDVDEGVVIAAVTVTVEAGAAPVPSFGYAQGVFNSRAIGNWVDVAGGATADQEDLISVLQTKGIIVKEAQL